MSCISLVEILGLFNLLFFLYLPETICSACNQFLLTQSGLQTFEVRPALCGSLVIWLYLSSVLAITRHFPLFLLLRSSTHLSLWRVHGRDEEKMLESSCFFTITKQILHSSFCKPCLSSVPVS